METTETNFSASPKKLPLWAWWAVGIAVIIAVAAGAVLLVANKKKTPELPPGLVERRDAAVKVLEEMNKIEDVDLKPLVDLETKKDYRGAVDLMTKALNQNSAYENVTASLIVLGNDLSKLSAEVKPDDVGVKAVEAFSALAKLAEAEKKYYQDRRALYEITKNYYSELDAQKKPPIPENLRVIIDAVNADFQAVKDLNQQFAAAVRSFDDAISMK